MCTYMSVEAWWPIVVSALISLSHYTVFLGKIQYFALIVPSSTQVYKWVLANLLHCTSIPSRGSKKNPSLVASIMLQFRIRSSLVFTRLVNYVDFTSHVCQYIGISTLNYFITTYWDCCDWWPIISHFNFMQSLAEELQSKAQSLGLRSEVVDLKSYEPEDSLSEEVQTVHVFPNILCWCLIYVTL